MSSEINNLGEVETNISNQTLLHQYKSSILEMKSEIELQSQELQNYLKKINSIISVVERAIKLSTGDIF